MTEADVKARLLSLLAEVLQEPLPAELPSGPGSLRALGLTSVQLLRFFVAIEDEFQLAWDDDVDEAVTSSIEGITAHLTSAVRR
ncbi:MAG: hypothetical protein HOQ05_07350 [Corynebacteriales bacterium]|nr:hypothetical protein [Mycobacteriales bacterium]